MTSMVSRVSLPKIVVRKKSLKYVKEGIDFAKQLQVEGKYNSAIKKYESVACFSKKKLGINNYKTKEIYKKLGEICYDKKMYDKAIIYYKTCAEYENNIWKKSDIRLSHIYSQIGVCYRKNKIYKLSLKYFNKALKCENGSNGDIVSIYINIAITYMDMCECNKAMDKINKCISICKEGAFENETYLGLSYLKMADIYMSMNNVSSALQYYKLSYEKYRYLSPIDYKLRPIYEGLARIYETKNEYSKSLEFHEKALLVYKNILENGSERLYVDKDKYQIIVDYYENAFKFIEQKEDDSDMASFCTNIGKSYVIREKYDIAIDYYNFALSIINKKPNKNDRHLLDIYKLKADSYIHKEEFEEAVKNCNLYMKVYREINCDDMSEVAEVYDFMDMARRNSKINVAKKDNNKGAVLSQQA